jgi:hypothetical protein
MYVKKMYVMYVCMYVCLNEKVQKWVEAVEKLSKVAINEPQGAFVALSKSL